MTPTLADEIEALAKEATQQPWEWKKHSPKEREYFAGDWRLAPGILLVEENGGTPGGDSIDRANAALIVALVNNRAAIVAALREVSALKEEVERLRGALEPFAKGANAFDTITPGGSGRPCPDAATYCEGAEVTVGDFRRARAAFGGGG